ncbi:hypothetical protein DFH09DRAFT_1368007 [Mycena vulgaris]|nr:hypothetical protein DFH09DRAFT_1368007 [Mycena vulgaris]
MRCAIAAIEGVTGLKKVTGSTLTALESQLPTTQYRPQYFTQAVDSLLPRHPRKGSETNQVLAAFPERRQPRQRTRAAEKIPCKRYCNVLDSTAVVLVEYRTFKTQMSTRGARFLGNILGVTFTPTEMLDNDASGLGAPCLPGTTPVSAASVASPKPSTQALSFAGNIENTYRVFEALGRDQRHGIHFSTTVGILAQGALVKAVVAMHADVS